MANRTAARTVKELHLIAAAAALVLCLACGTAATAPADAPQPATATAAPASAETRPEQPGDETEAQRVVREATIAAIQTEHALTPTKDTSHMFRLSLEESACLRERSPDGSFSKFMRAVAERDLETTKALHGCLTRETAIVLLLMDHGGVAPELSDETWACINGQTEGIDIKAALALKHGLEPEKPQELDAFTLAGVAPLAMLVCVSDEEFDWTLRNSSGVSKGIDKSVVQSGRDFPYIRVGGGQ